MKPFDYDECVKNHNSMAVTRDGRKVRLLCKDRKGAGLFPIVGMVDCGSSEIVVTSKIDGSQGVIGHSSDLFTPAKRVEGWVNVYNTTNLSSIFSSKELACLYGDSSRTACIHVSFEEGEGL